MSEIGDAPLYNSCSLPIQVMTTGPLPAPSKCKSGLPWITGTCPGRWKQSFRQWLWSLGHIMPPHIFEVGLKVNTKVYLDVLKSVVIPWCNQVASSRSWVWQQDSVPAHKSKETQAWLPMECDDFVPFSHWPPPPLTWTRWTTSFGHMLRTSPTWPPTTPKPAWSPPSAEYSPSSCQCLWKRHAPGSRSVSRRWLRLKAATLNRCQLYYIIKLPELIFSIKVLKLSCSVVFFRTTILSFHPVYRKVVRCRSQRVRSVLEWSTFFSLCISLSILLSHFANSLLI